MTASSSRLLHLRSRILIKLPQSRPNAKHFVLRSRSARDIKRTMERIASEPDRAQDVTDAVLWGDVLTFPVKRSGNVQTPLRRAVLRHL